MEHSKSDLTAGGARPRLLRSWVSLSGLVVALRSLFSFLLLFVLDTLAHFTNSCIGVLTYLVAPGFLITGLLLTVVGANCIHFL